MKYEILLKYRENRSGTIETKYRCVCSYSRYKGVLDDFNRRAEEIRAHYGWFAVYVQCNALDDDGAFVEVIQ